MPTTGTKRGETARRIYAVLKRNPDLTTREIADKLPDITLAAVSCALHKMKKNGAVEVRNRKVVRKTGGVGPKTAVTYHVKYKSGAVPAAPKPKKVEKPKVEKPKAKKVEKVSHEALVVHHLTDIYKALTTMTDQQDALIAILKDTLLQLDATEQELERERQRRNWWDKLKGVFQ